MIESEELSAGSVRIELEADHDIPRVFEVAGGRACLMTRKSPARQTANEDGAALIAIGEDACVLAVADGAGGMPAGGTASSIALRVLTEHLTGKDPSDLRGAILDGIEAANAQILAQGTGSATTMVVAAISEGVVRTFHAGDSVAMITGQRGKLKHITVAHSPVGYAYESGFFDELEAAEHPERHLVSNMVGIPELRIEVGPPLKLAPRDTLLLASDGLLDNLLIDEVIGLVSTGPLHFSVKDLFDRCREHMGDSLGLPTPHPDDLTLLAFRPTPHSTRMKFVPG